MKGNALDGNKSPILSSSFPLRIINTTGRCYWILLLYDRITLDGPAAAVKKKKRKKRKEKEIKIKKREGGKLKLSSNLSNPEEICITQT